MLVMLLLLLVLVAILLVATYSGELWLDLMRWPTEMIVMEGGRNCFDGRTSGPPLFPLRKNIPRVIR